jgi:hypothetical protein
MVIGISTDVKMVLQVSAKHEFSIQPEFRSWTFRNPVGTARCAVPARAERAEQTVQDFTRGNVRSVA